jgi:hypothetical protein
MADDALSAVDPILTVSDPRASAVWTGAEDAILVWLVLSCPFVEFPRCWSSNLPGKRPEFAVPRFLEILSNPELVQRVNAECRNDIICHKIAPWTRHEHISLLRLVTNNSRCNPAQFLKQFPMLFHPSRTSSALNATNLRLHSKDQSFANHLAQFREFVARIHEEAQGKELAEIDCDVADVERILNENVQPVDEPVVAVDASIDSLRQRANDQLTQKDFGALVGSGQVRVLKKAKTVFGRASPKCKPDVDLAELNLQSISRIHCTILLASDLHFYARCQGSCIIVNGVLFKRGAVVRLFDRDVIDIGGAPFIFFENQSLLAQLRGTR